MSKANWAGVNPASGSGDASVSVTSQSANTGRNNRQTALTITSNAGTKTVQVNQVGTSAFVAFDKSSESVSKAAVTKTISGTTNAKTLTLKCPLVLGQTVFVNIKSLTVAGTTIFNTLGSARVVWNPSDDPGATSAVPWNAVLEILANETDEARSKQLILSGTDADNAYMTINQDAGDPTLEVDKTTITLAADGDSTAVLNITSNTAWEIS